MLSHWEVSLGVKALHLHLRYSSSPQISVNQTKQTKEPVIISLLLLFFFLFEKLILIFLLCRPMTAQPAARSFSMNALNCSVKPNIRTGSCYRDFKEGFLNWRLLFAS